ncbi:MAG: SusD/RagB family nutrient-binding outer membrane lipoprotein [Ferruginibacter sp.]|nr:SusD/RagB family nutrient-binding outer membrane lipoprotein [Ferruginibacter sp.]
MKIKIKKLAILATSLVVLGTGCKTNFDINASTEDLTAGSLNYRDVLPAALSNNARIVATDWKFLQNWMGYWARSGSYQNDQQEETYNFTNSFPSTNNPWTDLYYNNSSYNYVQTKAIESGSGFYEAIARIMKAHNFQLLTDVYGNIPYSEALKGNEVRSPKYDKGADIYKDLFRELDKAIALLKDPVASSPANNDKITTNDLVFKGNASMWIKFANTLKLRLLVHAYDVPEINAAAEVAIIEAEGSGYLQSGETAKINPGYSSAKPNPFYRAYAINENGVLASNADFVKANSYAAGFGNVSNPGNWGYYRYDADPRIDKFYVKPDVNPDAAIYEPADYHKGIPFGATSGQFPNSLGPDLSSINAINSTSPNTGLTPNGPASDAWIITSVESLFLQAEARERGIINSGPSAKDLLYSAVLESFTTLGLTTQDYEDYLDYNIGFPDVDYDEATDKTYTILSQKWFALNGIAPYEIWTDVRRTDIVYGDLVGFDPGPPLSILTGAKPSIPIRLFYPQSEYSFNEVNAKAQGTIDVFTSRIFWDKQ